MNRMARFLQSLLSCPWGYITCPFTLWSTNNLLTTSVTWEWSCVQCPPPLKTFSMAWNKKHTTQVLGFGNNFLDLEKTNPQGNHNAKGNLTLSQLLGPQWGRDSTRSKVMVIFREIHIRKSWSYPGEKQVIDQAVLESSRGTLIVLSKLRHGLCLMLQKFLSPFTKASDCYWSFTEQLVQQN